MEALVRAATRSAARKKGWFKFIGVVFNTGFVGNGLRSLQTGQHTAKERLLTIQSSVPTACRRRRSPHERATLHRGCPRNVVAVISRADGVASPRESKRPDFTGDFGGSPWPAVSWDSRWDRGSYYEKRNRIDEERLKDRGSRTRLGGR